MKDKLKSAYAACCGDKSLRCVLHAVCAVGVVLLLVVTVYFLSPKTPKRYITVTGTSTGQQANETAKFTATISYKDATKATAVAVVNKQSQKIIARVKALEILDSDIKTQSTNIYQDQDMYYENGVQKYRLGNWNVSTSIEITLRDLTKSATLTALLAKFDYTSVWGPDLSINQENVNEEELLAKAYEDASKKAQGLAGSMGKRLGKVLSAVEGYSNTGSAYPLKEAGMGGGGGGLEPGSTDVTKTLTVTFELR